MNRPRVFVSAVTGELRGARRRVAEILIRKGYEPVFQDIFGTEPGDLRPMLREKIESCHGLIQIVGDAYGGEPPEPDPEFGRCSYTQYEFFLARQLRKKTWLLLAGPDCARDTPPALLDLLANPAHLDPVGYQHERRELQRLYRKRPEFANHLRHTAENDLALDLAIERLDDELDELRKEFGDWQRTVLRLAAALLLLTGIVLSAVWWVKKRQDTVLAGQKEIVQGQKQILAGPKITTAAIRKQILQGSERKRDRDLAETKAKPSIEREKLREAALAAHESRIARIDELALSFAEIEGRADASAVFREMTRILEHEGLDFALAYIAEQKGGILERIRTRKETERQQSRTELQPLLSEAQLQATAGKSVAARANYRQILDLEPTYFDALDAFAWFLRDQSSQSERHGILRDAVADAEEAYAMATRLHTANPAIPAAQRLLSAAHEQIGSVLIKRGQTGDAAKAHAHYTRSLEFREMLLAARPGSAPAAREVSVSLDRLGDFLDRRGHPGDAAQALAYYTRCNEVLEGQLKADASSTQAMRDVSVTLNKLGAALIKRGRPGDAEQALAHYMRSLELADGVLKRNPGSPQAARDVSVSLEKMGGLLAKRGQRGDTEQVLGHYTRSLEIREKLLTANADSAQAARDVSVILNKLGDLLNKRKQPGDEENAYADYIHSLELRETLRTANPDSEEAARDVSVSLEKLAEFLTKRGRPGDDEKALGYYTRDLEICERLLKAYPDSAQAERDLSVCLNKLGDLRAIRGQLGDAEQALACYTRSLNMKEKLLTQHSSSAQTKRDVSVSLEKVAGLLAKRGRPGDAEQARANFTRSNKVREELLLANSDSAQAARDVWISCYKLAQHAERTGKEEAMHWWRRAYAVLAGMNEKGQFVSPEDLKILEELQEKVGK